MDEGALDDGRPRGDLFMWPFAAGQTVITPNLWLSLLLKLQSLRHESAATLRFSLPPLIPADVTCVGAHWRETH